MKRFAILIAILFAVPLAASADQLSDLQTQLASLLQQIEAIQAQISSSTASSTAATAATGTASTTCLTLSFNLYSGTTDAHTDGEVSALQQFLGLATTTGYFGPLTEQAVQTYQSAHDIVSSGSPDTTGYGYVGPRTRAAMACAGASIPESSASSTNTPSVSSDATGVIGQSVTIKGSGFSSRNSVQFGSYFVGPLAAGNGGTTITFTLPSSASECDPLLADSCALGALAVAAGVYPVSVNNGSAISSNSSSLTVTQPGVSLSDLLQGGTPANGSGSSITNTSLAFGLVQIGDCTQTMNPSAGCNFVVKWLASGITHARIVIYPDLTSIGMTQYQYSPQSNTVAPAASFDSDSQSGSHSFFAPFGYYVVVLWGIPSVGSTPVILAQSHVTEGNPSSYGGLNGYSSGLPPGGSSNSNLNGGGEGNGSNGGADSSNSSDSNSGDSGMGGAADDGTI